MKPYYLITLIAATLASCEQEAPRQPAGTAAYKADTVKATAAPDATPPRRLAGREIQGDFNGDGVVDSAIEVVLRHTEGNPVDGGSAGKYGVRFLWGGLPVLPVGCCYFRLVFEGDLDGDGHDELSLFQAPENGCTYAMKTYTFKGGKWKLLFPPFLIPSGCESTSDSALLERVYRRNDSVFYLAEDLDMEDFRLVEKQAAIQ